MRFNQGSPSECTLVLPRLLAEARARMSFHAISAGRRRRWQPVRFWIIGTMMLLVLAVARAGAADIPGDSVYQLGIPLVDQDGREFHLADHRGKLVLMSMFYTSCKFACPLVIDTLAATERALPPQDRERLDIVLVSFDPERDTPARLKSVFDQRHLDVHRWTLARTEAANVRKLGAALDIQYRILADGEFKHVSALVLLDAQGRVVSRTSKLGESDPEFVAALRGLLRQPL